MHKIKSVCAVLVVALGANAGAAEAQNPNWLDGSNCRDYLTGLGAPAEIPYGDREGMAEATRIIGYVHSVVLAGLVVYEQSGSNAPQALSNARFLKACYDTLNKERDRIRQALKDLNMKSVIGPPPPEERGNAGRVPAGEEMSPEEWATAMQELLALSGEIAERILADQPPFQFS